MRPLLLTKLCCPQDKSDLQIQIFLKEVNGDILEGLLTCATCNRYYPIVYGVPIMTPDEYREKALEEPILAKWGLRLAGNQSQTFMLAAPES